ncbi:unnamed protein product [Victoria cruziana]
MSLYQESNLIYCCVGFL